MNLPLTLAFRYLSGRKLRTALTTLAVIFGVMLIFGMNTVLPTMMSALKTSMQAMEGVTDFTITSLSGASFQPGVSANLMEIEGVGAVAASLEKTINLPTDFVDQDPSRPDRVIAVTLAGVTPEETRAVRAFPIIQGRYLQESDEAAAVITQTLADAYSVRVGESIRLPSTAGITPLTVVGLLPAAIESENEMVLVNLPQAQRMTGETGKVNIIRLNLVGFTDETRLAIIQQEIESAMGEKFKTGSEIVGDEFFTTMEGARIALSVFGAMALFMGGFIILNTFRTLVVERRRDIGMLRALGATRRTILGSILVEGVLQGVFGSAVGLVLGYLMAFGLIKVAQGPIRMFINIKLGLPVVQPELVAIAILLGVGVTVLAGFIPAWYASRITPLEALRPAVAEREYKMLTGREFWAGILFLFLAVLAILSGNQPLILPGGVLFLLGLVMIAPSLIRPFSRLLGSLLALFTWRQGIGGLAQGNLSRQPSRVAVTASTMLLSLAVIVAAGGLVSSMKGSLVDMVHDSLGSDYIFVPPSIGVWGGNIGAAPQLASELRNIEGVETVSTLRYAPSMVEGQMVSVLGIQPEDFQQVSGLVFIEGGMQAYDEIASQRALIANSIFMLGAGVKVGDTVDLATANGSASYRVAAIATDLLNAKLATVYISQANLQTDFGGTDDVFLQLNLQPGANRETTATSIRALGSQYPQFKVISGTDYYKSVVAQLGAAFSVIYILFAILAVPSLIAMVNTLTITVIERTREIGMIRAVGGTRRQIRNMVLAESLLLAIIGAVYGIVGGTYLAFVLVSAVDIVFPMGYTFPTGGIIAAAVIALVLGMLAAVVPARQASRLEIIQALRYE